MNDPDEVDWSYWSLPLGAALDAVIGDPRGWPHPVRAIGEVDHDDGADPARGLVRIGGGPRAERVVGVVLALVVIGMTGLAAWGVVEGCDRLGGLASLLGRSLLVYWGLAARSLGDEALRASEAADLETARRELSMIVGRDTESLDRPAICRACVETVAENCNDAWSRRSSGSPWVVPWGSGSTRR